LVGNSFLSTKQKSNNYYYNRPDRKDKPLVDKQKLLNRAHDRAVLNAIHQASNDIRQINKRETSEKKQSLETRTPITLIVYFQYLRSLGYSFRRSMFYLLITLFLPIINLFIILCFLSLGGKYINDSNRNEINV
jgi:hypothetical protein